jgi:hypothetical protein
MARHDIDPVLQQLVRAIDESGQAAAPVTVSVRGTVLAGDLIAQRTFFGELVAGHPLMSALESASGLLGKEYANETEAAAGHYLHLRGAGLRGDGEVSEGLWRLSLESIDGWTLHASADAEDDRGPFARLLGSSP